MVRPQSSGNPRRVADEAVDLMTSPSAMLRSLKLSDVLSRKRTPTQRAIALAKAGIIDIADIPRVAIRLGNKKRR